MRDLQIENPGLAHHDPDLDAHSLPRGAGWRPIFGQAGQASKHLMNQGVTTGDVFLFFGRFRRTQRQGARLAFTGEALHVLWGHLEIGEIRDPVTDPRPPSWAGDHPHYACKSLPWYAKNNRVYIASTRSWLNPDLSGGGRFPAYRDQMRLTSPGGPMSKWRLPLQFHPERCGALMSNTSVREWSKDDAYAYVQVTGQRQEFVIEMNPEIEKWAREMIQIGASPNRSDMTRA